MVVTYPLFAASNFGTTLEQYSNNTTVLLYIPQNTVYKYECKLYCNSVI